MRRTVIVLSCIAVLLALAGSTVVADNMSSSMKSKPGGMDWLVGTWTCTAQMMAMGTAPAQTETDSMTFQPALNGVWMMQTYKGKRYSGQSYWRWDKATNMLVSVGVDGFGGYGTETSKGMGGGNTMTMAGTWYYRGQPGPVQDLLTKISNTQMRHVGKYQDKGAWHQTDDTTCTKNS